MKIVIMGAGALGSVAGGLLAQKGHEVTLIGRPAHMNAIAQEGLHIHGIWGEHQVSSLKTVTSAAALSGTVADLILITVKSYDTEEAVKEVLPLVGQDTLLCSYQNGLGNIETIAEKTGWKRTFGARVIFGACIPRPGQVEVTVMAAPTAFGIYREGISAETVSALASLFNSVGLPTVFTDTLETLLWEKVAYNCALNPLSALLNVPYGDLALSEHTREIMKEVIAELYEVARRRSVPLTKAAAEDWLIHFYENLLPPTAAHYASMHADLQLGRPTEIDALNGAIVQFGAELGVDCPTNELLTRLIHAREALRES